MPYESLSRKLSRLTPPSCHITYDVETGDAVELRELPFVVGVLADLSGAPKDPLPRLRERRFVQVDTHTFDYVLKHARPCLRFNVVNTLAEDDMGSRLAVELSFQSMQDFSARSIALQVFPLRQLLLTRDRLSSLCAALFGNSRLEENLQELLTQPELRSQISRQLDVLPDPSGTATPDDTLNRLLDSTRAGTGIQGREIAAEWLRDFIRVTENESPAGSREIEAVINSRLLEMDRLISVQLDEVLHQPELQRLEATWRGLWHLVSQSDISERLRISVLNVSKHELARDLDRAADFDDTQIFKKIYDEQYATIGGFPYTLLIGDYYFGRNAADVTMLSQLSALAASCHSPFLAAAAPEMFNLTSFEELKNPRSLEKIFFNDIYLQWIQFRRSEDARFVGLVMPRLLLRQPYSEDPDALAKFYYEEQMLNHEDYLWGNPAYALGVRLAQSFVRCGWFPPVRGVEGGGLTLGLPVHVFSTDEGDTVMKCPTELALSEMRESELLRLGFIPHLHVKGTDTAVFTSIPSCYAPSSKPDRESSATDLLSANLEYVFGISRFTHYLRCIVRDKIGNHLSTQKWEELLNQWVSQYVVGDDEASAIVKAKYPLRSAQVTVTESFGNSLTVRLEILPHLNPVRAVKPLQTTVSVKRPLFQLMSEKNADN